MESELDGAKPDLREWLATRAALNHDFLQNRFVPSLLAAVKRGQEGRQISGEGLTLRLQEWQRQSPRLRAFLNHTIAVLSPRHVIGESTFASLPEELRSFLATTAESAFRLRHGLPAVLDELLRLHERIDELVQLVTVQPSNSDIKQLCVDVGLLSQGISALPTKPYDL